MDCRRPGATTASPKARAEPRRRVVGAADDAATTVSILSLGYGRRHCPIGRCRDRSSAPARHGYPERADRGPPQRRRCRRVRRGRGRHTTRFQVSEKRPAPRIPRALHPGDPREAVNHDGGHRLHEGFGVLSTPALSSTSSRRHRATLPTPMPVGDVPWSRFVIFRRVLVRTGRGVRRRSVRPRADGGTACRSRARTCCAGRSWCGGRTRRPPGR